MNIPESDRDRISKLPAWVRDLIKRLEIANEPMIEECVKLRKENTILKERAKQLGESKEALLELLRRAGQGGSYWADVVVRTLESYEIFQKSQED